MRILSDYQRGMSDLAVEVLRGVIAEHPKATVADLRELMAAHPSLGSVTLTEILGQRPAKPTRTDNKRATPREGWADHFAKAVGGSRRKKHTYDALHLLVDRFYLAEMLEEHHTITATARQLKITRVRLRSRLQALGLYDANL
jgi:DNA-binding NtrC family response regulator